MRIDTIQYPYPLETCPGEKTPPRKLILYVLILERQYSSSIPAINPENSRYDETSTFSRRRLNGKVYNNPFENSWFLDGKTEIAPSRQSLRNFRWSIFVSDQCSIVLERQRETEKEKKMKKAVACSDAVKTGGGNVETRCKFFKAKDEWPWREGANVQSVRGADLRHARNTEREFQ